jgi:hypothetical protein
MARRTDGKHISGLVSGPLASLAMMESAHGEPIDDTGLESAALLAGAPEGSEHPFPPSRGGSSPRTAQAERRSRAPRRVWLLDAAGPWRAYVGDSL